MNWAVSGFNLRLTALDRLQIFRPGSDKCNVFVADTLVEGGEAKPLVVNSNGNERLPVAAEWADPSVKIPGYSAPMDVSQAQPGDVIAQDHGLGERGNREGHVGIVVAIPTANSPGVTASANANENGRVTLNDWGFRSANSNPNNGEWNGAKSPPVVVRRPLRDEQE